MSIYITGDTHRDFTRIVWFTERFNTTKDDLLIILGDACINYFEDERDQELKAELEELPITLMLVRGNHEARPVPMSMGGPYSLEIVRRPEYGGTFLVEPEYPSLLFALDNAIYRLHDKEAIVYGGAYSVDKPWRLATGQKWFPDEQMNDYELEMAFDYLVFSGSRLIKKPNIVLAHTCPYNKRPVEMFLDGVDQRTVDSTMEQWFSRFITLLPEATWYCGHWHINKIDGQVHFLYEDIVMLEANMLEANMLQANMLEDETDE